jgi:hypothetical protein
VRADLTPAEFHRQWRKVSRPVRAVFFVAAPLVGLRRYLLGTRESIARGLSLDDRPSAEETLRWSPRLAPVFGAILRARDDRLIECLAAELDNEGGREKRVAIVYGAAHMRAVVRELDGRGFHCAEARWCTIISTS